MNVNSVAKNRKVGHFAVRWDSYYSDEVFEKNASFGDSKLFVTKNDPLSRFVPTSEVLLLMGVNGVEKVPVSGFQVVALPEISNPHMFFKSLWCQRSARVYVHIYVKHITEELLSLLFNSPKTLSMCEALTLIYVSAKLEKIGTAVEHKSGKVAMFEEPYSRDALEKLSKKVADYTAKFPDEIKTFSD